MGTTAHVILAGQEMYAVSILMTAVLILASMAEVVM